MLPPRETGGATRENMAQASVKQNIPEASEGYLRIPYLNAPHFKEMTNAEKKIYALVFSRSALKDKPEAVCRASYSDFMTSLGIGSKSTPSACLESLIGKGLIGRTKRFHAKAEYRALDISPDVPVMEMELFFKTQEFPIPREEAKRKLRDSESLILALIATHTKNPKTKCFTGSVSQIADMLGLCEKTVRAALDVLIGAKLVHCSERFRGRRYTKTLHLKAHKAIIRTMRHKRRKAPQEPKERRTETEIAHDTRTARDRFYAALRWQAERRADDCRARLERDERFRELESEIRALDPKIARAELDEEEGKSSSQSAALKQQQDILKARLLEIMTRHNISPPDLEPRTYCRCKKCSDTGFLPSGQPCDCYASEEDEQD